METNMVESPFAADIEFLFPSCLVHRRRPGQRIYAAVQDATQEDLAPIDKDIASLSYERAYSERHSAAALAAGDLELVHRRVEFIPEFRSLCKFHSIFNDCRIGLDVNSMRCFPGAVYLILYLHGSGRILRLYENSPDAR